MVDPYAGGTALGALIITLVNGARLRGSRREVERQLHYVRSRERSCQDKLSALETEMVTLRKLLPGGEWYVRLGLDHYPERGQYE